MLFRCCAVCFKCMQRVSIVRIPLLNFQQVTQNRIILIIGPSFQRLNYISWYLRARIPLRIIFVFSFRHRINNIQQSECHLAIYSFGHKEYVVFFFLSIQLNEKWCNWMRRIVRQTHSKWNRNSIYSHA